MPLLVSAIIVVAVNSYSLLARSTRVASVPTKVEIPSGSSSDLKGLGSMPVFLRIFRALDAVPQGGAKWT
eukprot:1366028-Karenia_brevis.AAC.1